MYIMVSLLGPKSDDELELLLKVYVEDRFSVLGKKISWHFKAVWGILSTARKNMAMWKKYPDKKKKNTDICFIFQNLLVLQIQAKTKSGSVFFVLCHKHFQNFHQV